MMLRFYCAIRRSSEPCRAVLVQAYSSNTGPKDTDHVTNDESKPSNKETADKKEVAKSKLANLLSSLSTKEKKSSSPAPEDDRFHKINTRRAMPKPPLKLDPEFRRVEKSFDGLDVKLVDSIKAVSEEVGGGYTTQSQLLQSLQDMQRGGAAPSARVSDILEGMPVEKRKTRFAKGLSASGAFSGEVDRPQESIKLFGAEPLNIFPVSDKEKVLPGQEAPVLSTWDAEVQRELDNSVKRVPANQFQELISWTKQGKVWTFPVDNEVGLEEEKQVGFHEHIFLEQHLAPWCPRVGPIRHFMEFVCVGLSKNPHITVERKVDNILWFRDYFDQKKQILQDVGALPAEINTSSTNNAEDNVL